MIGPDKSRAWMEIDLDAVAWNYRETVKAVGPAVGVMAVVKDESYGLGAVPIARRLAGEGCELFCVADLREALELREAGITGRILMLLPVPMAYLETAADYRIEFLVLSADQAEAYDNAAAALGKTATAHIKLDIGLGRLGMVVKDREQDVLEEIRRIAGLKHLQAVALLGHTTQSALIGGDALNREQLERFIRIAEQVEAEGFHFERHCLGSAPFADYPEYACDYIRVGALLYGGLPGTKFPFRPRPALRMYARVIQVKTLPEGTPISYGPIFHTLRETRVATVALGFSDGLRRSISGGGCMLLHGRRAPYIGKVTSDFSMLDVTDIPNVREGDIATVFGTDGDLSQTIEDYAALYPASVAETSASFTGRVPRFYVSEGKTFS